MNNEEKQKLLEFNCTYLSVGITEDGSRQSVISVPWEGTGNAFKMRLPNIYITPEDLDDKEIFTLIKRHTVVGCYIFVPMKDYGFLSEFKDLRDIYIRHGEEFTDPSCIKSWEMLYIENAHISYLNPPVSQSGSRRFFGKCLGLYNCTVDDMSALISKDVYFFELIVCNKKTEEDFNRWKSVHAGTYRYYDIAIQN